MTSIALAACVAAVLWTCCCCCVAAADAQPSAVAVADGPSLSEMAQFVEPLVRLLPIADWSDADLTTDEGRGKKNKGKPLKMAMMMAGTAAGSMMMMKAMGAIKLFIIHSFFATKLGLIVAAYLLLCKMAEMKKAPAKQTVKWVSPPSSHGFDEHPSPSAMPSHYSEPAAAYEPPEQPPAEQYGPPPQPQQQQPSDQYGPPPPSQQQFMPSSDFGGGDMQAHYSHVSPVTYRPMIHRGQPDKSSSSGRIR